MSDLWIRGARVLTLADAARPEVTPECADVLVREGKIVSIHAAGAVPSMRTEPPELERHREIEAHGRVLLPAFVDAHTHACWAGSRVEEWEAKLAGASYLELLRAGGGIESTVRAVREASEEELAFALYRRLDRLLEEGTTAIELKSGYGLSTEVELRMLRAIRRAAGEWPGRVRLTACLGHAIPSDVEPQVFVEQTIRETLPAVTAEFPEVAIDAYCEEGAWSLEDCLRLFDEAQAAGHAIRVHADQFHSLGMIPAAIARGYRSVDHLEASTPEELEALARSELYGVMLPACGFHLDERYANGRAFLDAGGQLAIASNYNPGSAPTGSMPFIVALAVRKLGLTPYEAIRAATRSPAELLGLEDQGRIEAGARADLVLLRHTDARELAFEFGGRAVDLVVCDGRVVYEHDGP